MADGFLPKSEFKFCIERMPLVSVDLCVSVGDKYLVLVKRKKPPAVGVLFTPGGRIFKNETFDQVIKRILKTELGIYESNIAYDFLNVFEHFYEDSAFSQKVSTHYVSLLFACKITKQSQIKMEKVDAKAVGHEDICLIDISDDLSELGIHKYTLQNIRAYQKFLLSDNLTV